MNVSKKRQSVKSIIFISVLCCLFAQSAALHAQSGGAKSGDSDLWTRDKILGDWGGARTDLEQNGITLDLRLMQFYQGVTSGGANTGGEYGGIMDYILNVDGHKLGLWPGFFVKMHATTQFGDGIFGYPGPFAFSNTAMLYPLPDYDGTAITGLYAMQMLSPKFGLVAGKINTVDLFQMIYPHSGVGIDGFMNINMLAPALPWFRFVNLSQMGGGALVLADDGQIQGGLLAFDTQNVTTTSGFHDLFDNGAGVLGLWRFFIEMNDKPGSILFAAGGSTGDYNSLERSDWGFVPGVGIVGKDKTGTWAGSVYYDQVFWQEPHDDKRNLRLFTGGSISDGDPSFGKFAGFAGLEATGLLFERKKDRAGIGGFYSELSTDFKNRTPIFGANLQDVGGAEAYYNAEITPWFHLTGDLQVVRSANDADDTAIVLGLRAQLDF